MEKPIQKESPYWLPLNSGWTRELVYRNSVGPNNKRADAYYKSPNGKKFRSLKEIERAIEEGKPGLEGLQVSNFTYAQYPLGVNDPTKEVIRGADPIRTMKRLSEPADQGEGSKKTKKARIKPPPKPAETPKELLRKTRKSEEPKNDLTAVAAKFGIVPSNEGGDDSSLSVSKHTRITRFTKIALEEARTRLNLPQQFKTEVSASEANENDESGKQECVGGSQASRKNLGSTLPRTKNHKTSAKDHLDVVTGGAEVPSEECNGSHRDATVHRSHERFGGTSRTKSRKKRENVKKDLNTRSGTVDANDKETKPEEKGVTEQKSSYNSDEIKIIKKISNKLHIDSENPQFVEQMIAELNKIVSPLGQKPVPWEQQQQMGLEMMEYIRCMSLIVSKQT